MRSYMNLAVVALAVSGVCPVMSAPIDYSRYGNLLVELKGRAPPSSVLSLGFSLANSSPEGLGTRLLVPVLLQNAPKSQGLRV